VDPDSIIRAEITGGAAIYVLYKRTIIICAILIIRTDMIPKSILKEIILLNRAFIMDSISDIIPRQAAEAIASEKTIILYGIRRSGKMFILYDLFR